jgi:hypothetical protein
VNTSASAGVRALPARPPGIVRTRPVDDSAGASSCIRPVVAAATVAPDPELLILERCAREIALEAGPRAVVHAPRAPRQARLLQAEIDAASEALTDPARTPRTLVYVQRKVVVALPPDELRLLFQSWRSQCSADTLLVVAIGLGRTCARPTNGRPALGAAGVAFAVDRIASDAGWDLCQLWSDGTARHVLYVFDGGERANSSDTNP